MIAKKMLALGKSDSAIRAIAAYGDARRSEIGSENVFDFSIGNPNVPTPEKVKNTLIELLQNEESLALHGYTAAPGAMPARTAAAAQEMASSPQMKAMPSLPWARPPRAVERKPPTWWQA